MSELLTPQRARTYPGKFRRSWIRPTSMLSTCVFHWQRGLTLRLENKENIPNEPCLVTTNHTHNYDFYPHAICFIMSMGLCCRRGSRPALGKTPP